jgi:hypothetical protein
LVTQTSKLFISFPGCREVEDAIGEGLKLFLFDGNAALADIDLDAGRLLPFLVELIAEAPGCNTARVALAPGTLTIAGAVDPTVVSVRHDVRAANHCAGRSGNEGTRARADGSALNRSGLSRDGHCRERQHKVFQP